MKKYYAILTMVAMSIVVMLIVREVSSTSRPTDYTDLYLKQINELNAKCKGETYIKMELVGDKFSVSSACTIDRRMFK